MLEKIRKLKDCKGFTLVELIVVLVILAILAALLVPALTGYIDKARKEAIIAETRQAVMAAQTIAVEKYGSTAADVTAAYMNNTTTIDSIKKLAEVDGTISNITLKPEGGEHDGKIATLTYVHGDWQCVYTEGASEPYVASKYVAPAAP